MDELLKILLETAEKNKKFTWEDNNAKQTQELAHINKLLYDAHIKEGFTSAEALTLVVAMLN